VSDKTKGSKLGFNYLYPELEAEEQRKKDALLSESVRPLVPSQTHSVSELVRAMAGMSIQARRIGQCYEVMRKIYADQDRPTVLLGLAGPLIAGGLRQVLREFIANGLVDVVVSTGAIGGRRTPTTARCASS
jgi:deoxyhypusine synthase